MRVLSLKTLLQIMEEKNNKGFIYRLYSPALSLIILLEKNDIDNIYIKILKVTSIQKNIKIN